MQRTSKLYIVLYLAGVFFIMLAYDLGVRDRGALQSYLVLVPAYGLIVGMLSRQSRNGQLPLKILGPILSVVAVSAVSILVIILEIRGVGLLYTSIPALMICIAALRLLRALC